MTRAGKPGALLLTLLFPVLLLFGLLLAGCGPDRPVSGPPPGAARTAQAAPSPLGPSGYGGGASGGSAPPDTGLPPDPLLGKVGPGLTSHSSDPLLGSDPLQGHGMPTDHTHWLSAQMSQAQVTVRLNGVRFGGFVAPGTHDVTQRLRRGVNTLSVTYQPQTQRSWASVVLTEGERGPSAAPLAAFRQEPSAPTAAEVDSALPAPPPVTRTFIFNAN